MGKRADMYRNSTAISQLTSPNRVNPIMALMDQIPNSMTGYPCGNQHIVLTLELTW